MPSMIITTANQRSGGPFQGNGNFFVLCLLERPAHDQDGKKCDEIANMPPPIQIALNSSPPSRNRTTPITPTKIRSMMSHRTNRRSFMPLC